MSNFIYKDQTNILKTKLNPCYTKICNIKCSVLSLYLYICTCFIYPIPVKFIEDNLIFLEIHIFIKKKK